MTLQRNHWECNNKMASLSSHKVVSILNGLGEMEEELHSKMAVRTRVQKVDEVYIEIRKLQMLIKEFCLHNLQLEASPDKL